MLVGVAQLCSTPHVAENLAKAVRLVASAASKGCKAVFLPEATDYIAVDKEQAVTLAQPIDGPFVTGLRQAARQHGIFVSVGVHESTPADPQRLFNSHVLISSDGLLAGVYRKLHLFDVNITNGPTLMESSSTIPGSQLVPPVATPFGAVGLATCYDMRFPEMSTLLRRLGSQIITYPSAFTIKTGVAHWEAILRCRAIETQCYVVAAAQVGQHTEKRASYGHAMIVDPWGKIVAACGENKEDVQVAEIDLDYLEAIRRDMPVESHRRHDVYTLSLQ
ncbi:Carbon-nitrogen hydrolase [Polyrhizophydium stewartii]|uniref:Carbon-nitrogen hydrolase n=1 Tax=Polyrhizophydium stewartii TaxID=2732419 RepID=A0ABR4N5F5_9FUNG